VTTLPEKLSREIERVTILREKYRLWREQAAVTAAIVMMTAGIDAGHTAAGGGDVIESIQAIRTLEGFTS
jgi:hypothetical protein